MLLLVAAIGLFLASGDAPNPSTWGGSYPLQLQNPFLSNPEWLQGASLGAVAQLWAWEHQREFRQQFSVVYADSQTRHFWQTNGTRFTSRNMLPRYVYYAFQPPQFRVPQNVREWIQLRMGRERYVLQISPVELALMAIRLYHRYHLRFHPHTQNIPWDQLEEMDVQLLKGLWHRGVLEITEWYRRVRMETRKHGLTFAQFKERVSRLKALGLVREWEKGNEVHYQTTVTRAQFRFQLEEQLQLVDAVARRDRFQKLRRLQRVLEE
ncbi:MAG: hypothetical protein GXO78_05300 [Calditrichaeota bacterium]|nr:hypothetical protein [Calditrichota bacterium]